MIGKRFAAVASLAAITVLAGCTNQKVGPTTYVTVVHTVAPTASRSAPASGAGSASSAPPTSTIRTGAMSRLPGSCSTRLPVSEVESALNGPVTGPTNFVVGVADPSIGRVSYLYCQYGTRRGTVAKLQIQVSLYKTAARAAARLKPTVADYRAHGAHSTTVEVGGLTATLLLGGSGNGYGPTSVLAAGQRTVAVTLRPGAFAAAKVEHDLTALTLLAARRTSP